MPDNRFDALARGLASATSRRGVLKALLRGASAGVVALAGAKAHQQVEAAVADGVCCGEGLATCSGTCVDTRNDLSNCGFCGHACTTAPAGTFAVCHNGACSSCPNGYGYCNGNCTNIQTDPHNCGQCGTSCSAGQGCTKGVCVACSTQTSVNRPLTECNGACVQLILDNQNCGACGNVCPPGQYCVKGHCAKTVCATLAASPEQALYTYCGDGCFDTRTDPKHCGNCTNQCGAWAMCINGSCVSCPAGMAQCGGTCVDTYRDTSNCGACGRKCTAPSFVCRAGSCCNPSFPDTTGLGDAQAGAYIESAALCASG
jgi:hypothetical protein